MGTEVAWVPLVAAALGSGASIYNARRTDSRRDAALAQSMRNTRAGQDRANAVVRDLIADTAASNPEAEKAKALAGYTEALRRSAGNNTSAIQQPGAASDAFKADAAKATLGVAEGGDKLAGLMARVDGAVGQRRNEANQRVDVQGILNMLGRDMEGQNFIDRLRMDSITENPWLSAFSQAANGFAGSYSGGGLTGGGKTARYTNNAKKYQRTII